LLAASLRLANFCHMRLKQALASRRPNEYSPQVQPMILTPSHSSYPSGHATESFLSAIVLWKLLKAAGGTAPGNNTKPYTQTSWLDQIMRLANRIAVNRTIAGVHFPIDSAAGAVLGLTLGLYFVARCQGQLTPLITTTYDAYKFDGTAFPTGSPAPLNDGDFYWSLYYNTATDAQLTPGTYVTKTGSALAMQRNELLNWLWNQALAEWT
jgi:hypothetical protein